MSAIILGWDPARPNRWNYAAVVEQIAAKGLHLEPWSVGRSVAAGTDVWLVVLGAHGPGLIGHGVVLSEQPRQPEEGEQPEAHGGHGHAGTVVQVAFDALLPLGDEVPAQVLTDAMPDVPWDGADGAGEALAPGDEAIIRGLWAEFGPAQGPDPTQPVPGTYPDGAVARAAVNRYERDAEARRACIAHRGTSCAACGFSFEMTYGEAGAGFIHVHHVVPASQLGNGYQLDPLTDLVPLCANCHAMAHHGVRSPRSEAELRQLIANAGYLRGATVTPEELEAQRAAREILGT
ncbi:MAG TPA: HNH endonuclease [Arthrobacter sp.]|nr:HNH endonuclease [Arthrobacter sp.]